MWTEDDLSELFDFCKSTHILNIYINPFLIDPSASAASKLMFIYCLAGQTRAVKIKSVEFMKA